MVAVVRDTTFRGNIAGSFGGGVQNQGTSAGNGSLRLENCTISGNAALDPDPMGWGGGGVRNDSAVLTLAHTTLADNTHVGGNGTQLANEGSSDIDNSVIQGGASACVGPISTNNATVISDASCGSVGIVGNANLRSLANYGGSCDGAFHSCLTRPPRPGSPARGAVPVLTLPLDQRGNARTVPCWSGAYQD